MKEKVVCVVWSESSYDNKKSWSLHLSEEDAKNSIKIFQGKCYDANGDAITPEEIFWALTSKEIRDKIGRMGAWFVDESDFIKIQTELFE
jgi:hypothetical protein